MRILLLALLFPFTLKAEKDATQLKQLIDQRDFFGFRKLFLEQSQDLETFDLAYCSVFYHGWFGKPESSNDAADILFKSGAPRMPDSTAAKVLQQKFKNYFRMGKYLYANDVLLLIEMRYAGGVSKDVMEDLKNSGKITTALLNVPEMTMERTGDLSIEYKRDIASLIRIPVSVNGVDGKFIVDSGANLSTINESLAEEMHLTIMDSASFGVTSSSQKAVDSKLGVADVMKIGDITFHHVIFIVLPDKALKFAGGIYKIKGIVGLPVLAKMGEIDIDNKNKFFSPMTGTTTGTPNIGFDANTVFANVTFYGQEHAYIFDTGAATTIFNANFQEACTDSIKNAKTSASHVGGAGGVQKVDNLILSNVHYAFGGVTGMLKRGSIQTSGTLSLFEDYYGIVGEDIFTQHKMMKINFDEHVVVFE